jgi:hypothetical protein
MDKYYTKLSKLHSLDLLQILHDCVELLAPLSASEMANMDGITKKAILLRMNAGKYMVFNFDGRKYPIVNDNL